MTRAPVSEECGKAIPQYGCQPTFNGKEKGKELVVFTKFADNLSTHSAVFLTIGRKTSKSVFKGEFSDMFEHFFEPLFRFLHIYYNTIF